MSLSRLSLKSRNNSTPEFESELYKFPIEIGYPTLTVTELNADLLEESEQVIVKVEVPAEFKLTTSDPETAFVPVQEPDAVQLEVLLEDQLKVIESFTETSVSDADTVSYTHLTLPTNREV